MIELVQGNLLEADVEALVNPVNTVDVMGKGLALAFKQLFPETFQPYRQTCQTGVLQIGSVFSVTVNESNNPRFVIHALTKVHFRQRSSLEIVARGLEALVAEVTRLEILSMAVPALGCGLGGLRWTDVLRLIQSAFLPLPAVQVLVFEPA